MTPSLSLQQDIPRNVQLGIASLAVITSYYWLTSKRQDRHMDSKDTSIVTGVDAAQVFSSSELSQLTSSYGDSAPEGHFCKGRHGYTHYILDQPPSDTPVKVDDKYGNLIIMAHGLGNSSRGYKDLAKHMTALGYHVLRYDYFGHGYSKYDSEDMWLEYTTDMLIDQLEDVLDHVVNISSQTHNLKVSALVGHSTGGLLGIGASARWSKSASRVLPRIILLSPAIWAHKPIVAQIADKIPRTLTSLIKNVSSFKVLITDAYFDGMKIAFAIDPQTKKYVYEAQEEKQQILNHRIFGKEKNVPVHPFLHAAILGLNCHTLRADLLPKHRDTLVQVLQDMSAHSTQHVLFVWGNLDLTVPYKKNISQVKEWMEEYPKLELKEMDRMGHELLAEDSNSMANVLKAFLEKTD